MNNLFFALLLLSFLGLIIGLLSPKIVILWGIKKTRGQVFLIYGISLVVFFILFGITSSPTTEQVSQKSKVKSLSTVKNKPIKTFSILKITDIAYEAGKVKITGTTDLPDNSQLNIDFNVAGRLGTDTYIGVSKKVNVKGGKYAVMISPPNRPEFVKGSYVVSVMFTPRAQPDYILKLIGKDGEYLKGDKIRKSYGFNIMETSKKANLQLNITSYPMVKTASYSANSPERAFIEFLISWKKKDWDRMSSFTQKTWRSKQKDSTEMLEAWYGFKELLGAKIVKKNTASNVSTDITAIIYYVVGSEIETKTITAKVICEIAPYKVSKKGKWGVNPVSTLP
ncbi:MAG: hypothetical protein GY730_04570, partial [bacterium]|nr:hypothetical protein [bacterium]